MIVAVTTYDFFCNEVPASTYNNSQEAIYLYVIISTGCVRISLLTLSLLNSEDLWLFLDFPALAVFSAHLAERIKARRSPGTASPEILTK